MIAYNAEKYRNKGICSPNVAIDYLAVTLLRP